jgi:hypothetical protein
LIAVGAILLTACGGGDDVEKPRASGTTTTAPLRNADDLGQRGEGSSQLGEIGKQYQIHDLRVTVKGITNHAGREPAEGDAGLIDVELRVENGSEEEQNNGDVTVVCSNTNEDGSWYVDSTYDPNSSFPASSFREGTIILGVPVTCEDAAVSFTQTKSPEDFSEPGVEANLTVLLPDEVVAGLGSSGEPSG